MANSNFTTMIIDDPFNWNFKRVMIYSDVFYDYSISQNPIGVIGVMFKINAIQKLIDTVREIPLNNHFSILVSISGP